LFDNSLLLFALILTSANSFTDTCGRLAFRSLSGS